MGLPRTPHDSPRFPKAVILRIIVSRFGGLKIMNEWTYGEGILSEVSTGILYELVYWLEKITNELILAVVVVRGFFVF